MSLCCSKEQGGCLILLAFATKYLQRALDFPHKNLFCQNGTKDPNVNEIETHIAHYGNAHLLQKGRAAVQHCVNEMVRHSHLESTVGKGC